MGIGIAHHREFHLEVDEFLQRLGDDVLVQHVGDGGDVARPRGHHVAVGAGAVDHMLAIDVALVGEDAPFAVGQELDVGDTGAAVDGGTEVAGSCGHGVGHVGGRHMAIGDGAECRLDAEGLEEGMVFLDLGGADDLALVSCQLRDAVDVLKPVHFLVGGGEAEAAAGGATTRLPGELLELRIELGAVHVHLGHVERAVEVRTLSGGMPGGAGGEFALLEQNDVGPAFEGEVVEQPHAHDAASDNDHPRMRFHE